MKTYSVSADLITRGENSDIRTRVKVHHVPSLKAAWVSHFFAPDDVIEPDGVLDIESGHQDDRQEHSEMLGILSEHGWTLA